MLAKPHATPSRLRRRLHAGSIFPFLFLIRAYQATLRPFLGGQCRFRPTCSDYALEAYRLHGPLRGTSLTIRRILRCRPFTPSGYDPVPPPEHPCAHAP